MSSLARCNSDMRATSIPSLAKCQTPPLVFLQMAREAFAAVSRTHSAASFLTVGTILAPTGA